MERIRATLGVGNIYFKSSDNTYRWKVSNINDIFNVIIPHFIKYPLVTQKRADFELFTRIVEILKNKGHIDSKGLQQIVNLKASLNLGLSENLKKDFPDTVMVPRSQVRFEGIPDPNWLSGFANFFFLFFFYLFLYYYIYICIKKKKKKKISEACFFISIYKSLKSKLGFAVQLVFKITQHSLTPPAPLKGGRGPENYLKV